MSISAVPWDDRSILKDRAPIPTLQHSVRIVTQSGRLVAIVEQLLYCFCDEASYMGDNSRVYTIEQMTFCMRSLSLRACVKFMMD